MSAAAHKRKPGSWKRWVIIAFVLAIILLGVLLAYAYLYIVLVVRISYPQ